MLHYAVGTEIGEFSLASGFDGLLPSRLAGNRPFLRCLQGLGRCLWRLKRFDEADTVFERLLLLDPADDLGARFALEDVRAQIDWATG
jgi:tetratricopeptide (TPR) repeat protein